MYHDALFCGALELPRQRPWLGGRLPVEHHAPRHSRHHGGVGELVGSHGAGGVSVEVQRAEARALCDEWDTERGA